MTLEPGMVVGGDFRIDSRLREGGMGQVWIAEQLSLGRKRALKVMRSELLWDARLRERFIQEARIGATIDSDHVVEVVAAGIDEKLQVPWLAMELLDGRDLEAAIAIQKRGGLPWAEAAHVASQLGHALAAAHAVGVVHRDLKPENVFLARSRRSGGAPFDVKVLDFGLAKLVEGVLATSGQSALIGTPLFMAPEQTEISSPSTPAIDVWALGLVAYRMLTGRHFWRSATGTQSITSILREVLFDPIPLPSMRASADELGHALPPGFDAWFSRCVARDAGARFAEAGEACAALTTMLGGAATPEHAPVRAEVPASAEPSVNVSEAFRATVSVVPPEVEELAAGPQFSLGRIADILVVRWWATPTIPVVKEMGDAITRAVSGAAGRMTVMPVVDTSLTVPPSDVRDALQEVIKRHERAVERVSYVVLGTGFQAATLRAVMTGMVLAIRPQHSTKVYTSPGAALEPWGDRPETPEIARALDRFIARDRRPKGPAL
jgi:serine/threonine protein kinase